MKSKPTWPNLLWVIVHVGFFVSVAQDVWNPFTEGSYVTFHGGETMPLATVADARWNGLKVVAESCSEHDHKDRILEALGPLGEQLPSVDERTCSGYYKYLKARLSFPFTAHYPEPMNSEEEDEFRCTVSELLDPAEHLGDGFDGVFCTTCKDQYELKLPLIDLYLPEDSFSFQVINDYWFWYWNWH